MGYAHLINNVETLANVAAIIREGGEWFRGRRNGEFERDESVCPGRPG